MKQYMKPTITQIKIAPNQAIAACASPVRPFDVKFVGYGTQWDGGRNGIIYSSKEDAENANRGSVCTCFDIHRPDDTRMFSWEDYNHNGIYDSADNVQNVESYNEMSATFMS